MSSVTSHVLSLPELIIEIFSHLPLPDICSARFVNKQWASILQHKGNSLYSPAPLRESKSKKSRQLQQAQAASPVVSADVDPMPQFVHPYVQVCNPAFQQIVLRYIPATPPASQSPSPSTTASMPSCNAHPETASKVVKGAGKVRRCGCRCRSRTSSLKPIAVEYSVGGNVVDGFHDWRYLRRVPFTRSTTSSVGGAGMEGVLTTLKINFVHAHRKWGHLSMAYSIGYRVFNVSDKLGIRLGTVVDLCVLETGGFATSGREFSFKCVDLVATSKDGLKGKATIEVVQDDTCIANHA